MLEKSALVLIDIQNESRFGIEDLESVVDNAKHLLSVCRNYKVPVIYTRQMNRRDLVGISRGEELDDQGTPIFYRGDTQAVNIIDDIAPVAGDIVLDKYRWSAFYQTSLELFLKSLGVEHVIIGGLVTDGCLMSSVFDAYYRDYQIHLVKDMCATTCSGGHISSVLMMANWIYGIKIYNTRDVARCLQGKSYCMWESNQTAPFRFTPENMRDMYSKLDSDAFFMSTDT